MAAFIIRNKIDLSHLSDDWKDCYVVLRDLTPEEVQRNVTAIAESKDGTKSQIQAMMDLMESTFIEGKGYDGEKIVDIKKEKVKDLPLSVVMHAMGFLFEKSSETKTRKPAK